MKRRGLIRTTLRKEKPDIVVLLKVKKERIDNMFVGSVENKIC